MKADTTSNVRPAALFVAPIMPSDRGNGLAMRSGFLLDSYAKRYAVDLAVVPVAGGTNEITSFVQARVRRAIVLPVSAVDTHFGLIASIADPEARLAAFRQYGRPSITSPLNAELERALVDFAGNRPYRLVHVSRLYLTSLARLWMQAGQSQPCLVLDCDEDDVSAYRRFARLHRNWGRYRKAAWAEAEADAFKGLAQQSMPRFDLLLAASASEAKLIRARAGNANVAVLPNVTRTDAPVFVQTRRREGRKDILFVGNMGYLPNSDAVMWFAMRIWQRLRRAVPEPLRFVIAGHGAPSEVRELARQPNIIVEGGFGDPAALYRRAALVVVPVRAGGGTRIKLLESAKYGVPVVATHFGAEGSGFRSGEELLLADAEQDFASACARLLTDTRLASRLAARAKDKLRRDYDARRFAEQLLGRIDALTETGGTR